MLHLVRHADAGNRMTWVGDDFLRPLDDFGQTQAEAIGVALASQPVRRILSSAAVRCVDTVVPLGRALGLPVEVADELAEGTFVGDAFDLLRSLASAEGDSVLCSHGDVIPRPAVGAGPVRAGHPRSGPLQEGVDLAAGRERGSHRRRHLPAPAHVRRGLTAEGGPDGESGCCGCCGWR